MTKIKFEIQGKPDRYGFRRIAMITLEKFKEERRRKFWEEFEAQRKVG